MDLHNPEASASALGANADDGVGARSRNYANVLRWWKFEWGRRKRCDRDAGRNIYDLCVCECDGGFDHADAHYEAYSGRAIAALAGLISLSGYCVNQFIGIALGNRIVLPGRELRTKSRARHPAGCCLPRE